jgi:hypothetical protein
MSTRPGSPSSLTVASPTPRRSCKGGWPVSGDVFEVVGTFGVPSTRERRRCGRRAEALRLLVEVADHPGDALMFSARSVTTSEFVEGWIDIEPSVLSSG